ncbi:MAG: hypothetical protein E7013_06535 [Alphaproteobacteria bacterium]|nr:hypothetical protein [Alphaproteobacteria bacterium]
MKKNKTDTIRRKIMSNYIFFCTEGPYILLSLFYRMGLIHRSELEMLCSRLLDTPLMEQKISQYLGEDMPSLSYDEDDDCDYDDDYNEASSSVKKQPERKNATANSAEEDNQIVEPESCLDDLVICYKDKKEFLLFKQVCDKMKRDGYLNCVDLPEAVKVISFFSPTLAIKATELDLFDFDDESYVSLKNDIETYHMPFSSLSLEEKISWLSFCVAKASDDIQANSDLKNATMLRNDLVQLLSGIPEYLFNKKLEELNHTIIRQEPENRGALFKKYVSSRLRSCFIDHVLPLERHLQITKAMYRLENMSFDDEKSFFQKARPIISEALKEIPPDLKREYISVFFQDAQGINFDSKKIQGEHSWVFNMVNYISRCFELLNPQKVITKEDALVKLSDLTRLANIAIGLNPEWSMSEKDAFWDVVAGMKIKQVPSSVSKYKTLQKFSKKEDEHDR